MFIIFSNDFYLSYGGPAIDEGFYQDFSQGREFSIKDKGVPQSLENKEIKI